MNFTRRRFLSAASASAAGFSAVSALNSSALGEGIKSVPNIAGFDETFTKIDETRPWEKYSDRKIRVGLVGYGVCRFSTQFSLQNHPNAEVAAVSDLVPERCAALAKEARCEKTYPSLEEMLNDDSIEAIFLATDAPSHCRQSIEVLKRGKHVAVAVPAMFGNLEEAFELYETVKAHPELVYAMFETTAYRDSCYAMRQLYRAGAFGKMVYSEGEYYHYSSGGIGGIGSWKNWRRGLPPQYYPTHSNGFYCCVTGGSFTEVSCMGVKSLQERYQDNVNAYQNQFGTEIALFRTSEGGTARMAVSWDTPQFGGEMGRCRGQLGSFYEKFGGNEEGNEIAKNVNIIKPALPPGVEPGGHGGSHGYLGHDFIDSILRKRSPLVDVRMALNLSIPGFIAHQSALKDGELLKIPQFN
ncbi:MAG: Gfo/Idh/MocA family oxidoreductase [Planctomycetaceae bacterium]|nr:Gfo/Idh/MocA family oxidoreductase [Planctomycetaceae bacterium]MDO4424142.1 Gfo/Idh/MocA family oxidoreductase [Planctomycetia bacterium]